MAGLICEVVEWAVEDVPMLVLRGDLDFRGLNLVKDKILDLFDAGKYELVIDVANVNSVDNPGIELMRKICYQSEDNNGLIIFICPRQEIYHTCFEVTGLDRHAEIVKDSFKAEDALTMIRQQRSKSVS